MWLTARTTAQIIIARFLTGISSGMAIVVATIFVCEITQLSIRGTAITALALMYNVGILVSYIQGWVCSYNVVCYISVTSSVVYTLVLCCMKETP
ncbi:Solute carrier family 2, facilitated glucose transporter member 8, partial [Operophtera brumata]